MSVQLTARQHLEKRGAFYYILAYIFIFITSVIFQYAASVQIKAIMVNVIMSSFNIMLAIVIFKRKSLGLKVVVLPWVVGFLSLLSPIAVKFSYALKEGWTFAVQSSNSSALMVLFVIMLYLFYQPGLFKFFSIVAISSWIALLYLAWINGAEYHWNSV